VQPHPAPQIEPRVIGRYALYDEIASGGMATVHLGRLLGSAGFSRTVAIKRLHPQYAKDPDFVTMFVDEARLAARIHHPNVVATLDVVSTDGELFLVMEYVMGESLGRLIPLTRARGERIPPAMVATVMSAVLHGLHAAHEARDEHGVPLGIVHRDVSPQNVLVGVDGTARVLDFGVAKAAGRLQTTREGQLKGKIAYMAPEQIRGVVDRTTDVYAASVVFWEALTGKRLFQGDSEVDAMRKVLDGHVERPSTLAPDISPALEQIVLRGLDLDPARRFQTAGEMALAVEDAVPMVGRSKIGRWVEETAMQRLAVRTERLAAMESNSAIRAPRLPAPASGTVPQAAPLGDSEMPTTAFGSGVVAAAPLPPAPEFSSVTHHTAPQRAGGRVAFPIVAGILTLAAVAGVVWFGMLRHRGERSQVVDARPSVTASAAPVAPVASTASPPGSASAMATAPAPPASTTAPVPTTAVSLLPLAPLPRAPFGPPPVVAPPRPTATTPPAHPAADCSPPYYFNAQGDRIFKKECM
jgi:serine/threonine-protein kinase